MCTHKTVIPCVYWGKYAQTFKIYNMEIEKLLNAILRENPDYCCPFCEIQARVEELTILFIKIICQNWGADFTPHTQKLIRRDLKKMLKKWTAQMAADNRPDEDPGICMN